MSTKKKPPFPPPEPYRKPPLKEEAVKKPAKPEAAPAGGAAVDPLDAAAKAKAAAAEPAKPAKGAGSEKPGEPPLGQTQEQAAAALVMMSQVAVRVGIKFYAARCKVKLTPAELGALSSLTPEEVSNLMTYAPYAAPFVWEILQKYGKYIGAGLYGLILYDSVLSRFGAIKEIAKERAPAKPAEKPAPGAPAPAPEAATEEIVKPASFKVLG